MITMSSKLFAVENAKYIQVKFGIELGIYSAIDRIDLLIRALICQGFR